MRKSIIFLMMGLLIACGSSSSTSYQETSSDEYLSQSQIPRQRYDEQTAKMLGRLYYLANPYAVVSDPTQITDFVRSNALILGENSQVIRCARDLGTMMINQGIRNFNAQGDRERMLDLGQSAGVDPVVTERAANEMYNGSADLYAMGRELVWLSQVIPSAAQGNWDPFNTTGTDSRLTFYQVWPLVQIASGSDPSTLQLFDQLMKQFQPLIEYQVLLLAMMLQN